MEHGGCYIFLSHASANINIVRRIRNEFESLGQNPIAFHLRCLDENYKGRDEELWNLIYREIDAREWFVYCQSPEAKESDNVQKEYAYIKQAGKDKIGEIDITEDWEVIRKKIHIDSCRFGGFYFVFEKRYGCGQGLEKCTCRG